MIDSYNYVNSIDRLAILKRHSLSCKKYQNANIRLGHEKENKTRKIFIKTISSSKLRHHKSFYLSSYFRHHLFTLFNNMMNYCVTHLFRYLQYQKWIHWKRIIVYISTCIKLIKHILSQHYTDVLSISVLNPILILLLCVVKL